MTRLYVIVRTELTGGSLLVHAVHAAREAQGPRPTEDERACVLVATKSQLDAAMGQLADRGIPFKACVETDGPMAGVTPSIGFAIEDADRHLLPPAVTTLKVWRPPAKEQPKC